jgi:hypothetical protein
MNAPKRASSVALHFRIAAEESRRLDALCVTFPVPKASVARRALQLGMAALETDPAAFANATLEEPEEPTP